MAREFYRDAREPHQRRRRDGVVLPLWLRAIFFVSAVLLAVYTWRVLLSPPSTMAAPGSSVNGHRTRVSPPYRRLDRRPGVHEPLLRGAFRFSTVVEDNPELTRRGAATTFVRIFYNERPLTMSEWIRFMQPSASETADAAELRDAFIFFLEVHANHKFRFFFECPPVTQQSRATQPFEFVLVAADQFDGARPDSAPFAAHLRNECPAADATAAGALDERCVRAFPNLGGDAQLVVPCQADGIADFAYTHIATFSHSAPVAQRHILWARVAKELDRRLSSTAERVWLSTSGLGVYWLHVRLDSTPKYYQHQPYRTLQP